MKNENKSKSGELNALMESLSLLVKDNEGKQLNDFLVGFNSGDKFVKLETHYKNIETARNAIGDKIRMKGKKYNIHQAKRNGKVILEYGIIPLNAKAKDPKRAPSSDSDFRNRVYRDKQKAKEAENIIDEVKENAGLNQGRKKKVYKKVEVVTTDIYNEAYREYVKIPTVEHLVKTLNLSKKVAFEMVHKGFPAFNMKPLKARYEAVVATAEAREDYTLAQARSEFQGAGRILLNKCFQRLKSMDPENIDVNKVSKMLLDAQSVIERSLGVADATFDVKVKNKYEDWTEEQLKLFIETGKRPESDISIAPIDAAHTVSKE